MSYDDAHDWREEACAECPLHRRTFLRQLSGTAMGALVMLGMPPGIAAMVEPEPISPRRTVGSLPSYPVPAADGVKIDRGNQVILVRWNNRVYAFNLACPHQNAALRWNAGDEQFQCPKHHSRYQPDGTFISGRATRNMDRFPITLVNGEIVVDVDDMHRDDKEPAQWNASEITLPAS
jgi:nitrite reductase/ring-hydroxylating ferredoxin subunit